MVGRETKGHHRTTSVLEVSKVFLSDLLVSLLFQNFIYCNSPSHSVDWEVFIHIHIIKCFLKLKNDDNIALNWKTNSM